MHISSSTSPTLLRVDSSPRTGSVTNSLTAAYAEQWSATRPGSSVRHHDLPALNLPHLNSTEMGAWFTEPDDQTDLHHLVLARSNGLIDDLLAADELVIGAPMWNFSIPSSLKAWIDHVTKAGRTINFGPEGPVGAVTATRAVVISSRGSEYKAGTPTAALDLQEPYMRLILGFLGVAHVEFVSVERQGPSYSDGKVVYDEAHELLMGLARADDVDIAIAIAQ